jgi:hypothetical protein
LIWSEVCRHYFGGLAPESDGVLDRMRAAYDQASLILRLQPGMPMSDHHTKAIDRPIARIGRARPGELRRAIGWADATPVALCAFGGMVPNRPSGLASNDRIALIGPAAWGAAVTPVERFAWPFEDLIASADVVLSKPGYGIVAELGCNGTPAILASRGDWPEEPCLVSWLRSVGRCRLLTSLDDIDAGAVVDFVAAMRAESRPTPALAGGEEGVALACHALFG